MPLLVAIMKQELPFLSADTGQADCRNSFRVRHTVRIQSPDQDLGRTSRQHVGFSHRMGQGGQGHLEICPGRSQGGAGYLSAEPLRVMVTSLAQPTVCLSEAHQKPWKTSLVLLS